MRPDIALAKELAGLTIYRGVALSHPAFRQAKRGMAEPWGGHSDPMLHVAGDTRSIFTSWSLSKYVATQFATIDGALGVVLMYNIVESSLLLAPPNTYFDEDELLLIGRLKDLKVVRVAK